jgi:hypothetical protein
MDGGKSEGRRPSLAWWASLRKPPVMSAWPNIADTLSCDDDEEGEEDGELLPLLEGEPLLPLLLPLSPLILLHLIAPIAASNSVLSLL